MNLGISHSTVINEIVKFTNERKETTASHLSQAGSLHKGDFMRWGNWTPISLSLSFSLSLSLSLSLAIGGYKMSPNQPNNANGVFVSYYKFNYSIIMLSKESNQSAFNKENQKLK